jgi:glutamine cyclotransferase
VQERGEQYVLANVYLQRVIVKISLKTGKVVEKRELDDLYRQEVQSGGLKSD